MSSVDRFIYQLAQSIELSDIERTMLRRLGIGSPERLYVLAHSFPSLDRLGVDIDTLRDEAFKLLPAGSARLASSGSVKQRPKYALGARSPTVATPPLSGRPSGGSGSSIGADGGLGTGPTPGSTGWNSIRYQNNAWKVRDQGKERGTCVSFAILAIREWLEIENGKAADSFDLSEQYHWWLLKSPSSSVCDSWPSEDASTLDCGLIAMEKVGTCEHKHWAYVPHSSVTLHHGNGDPDIDAHNDAAMWKRRRWTYICRDLVATGKAVELFKLLTQRKMPLAITLPVFEDPVSHIDNWNYDDALDYGIVADPFDGLQEIGGHAVCVVGFKVDDAAPGGGWFIIRNSWGDAWARFASRADATRNPGYGVVSASYVDQHLWEVAGL